MARLRTSFRPGIALTGLALTGLLAGVGAATLAPASEGATGRTLIRHPHPSPSHFTRGVINNEWFPLKAGTRYVYRGVSGHATVRDVMEATYRTKVIEGVTCRVVLDRGYAHGRLTERTFDWYAQTKAGVVWYFGENTTTFDKSGHPTGHEGSFQSGVNGAQAGIFMTPHPHMGPVYAQENLPGVAEDRFTVFRHGGQVSVPLLTSRSALVTKEFSPIEPGVIEHKFYVRNVGDVYDVTVHGGHEDARLVAVTHFPHP
ncbi:hypothetical protein [Nocardioides cynanchi]|uniref:hypothetical protein n=1 Tax=Nocardioides cynanchi TaxID=2558918 RepID=UPI0012447456|nr:hypothetical protein [Nocardioides cynanchi]